MIRIAAALMKALHEKTKFAVILPKDQSENHMVDAHFLADARLRIDPENLSLWLISVPAIESPAAIWVFGDERPEVCQIICVTSSGHDWLTEWAS